MIGNVPFLWIGDMPGWSDMLALLSRCLSPFHPDVLKEPVRISDIDGALATTLPVAAHMPGGGVASMSLMLADRRRLAAEVEEAFVELRDRRVGLVGEVGVVVAGCDCWGAVVCVVGKGGAVGVLGLEDAIEAREPQNRDFLVCLPRKPRV